MKHILFTIMLLLGCATFANAQDAKASIKFEQLKVDFGTFSESEPVQKGVFRFTNEGTAPLVIHQAVASCGCTVPEYTKEPIQPGESGQINVTYNGKGKFPGHFKKTITIRTNGDPEMTRVFVEGTMTEKTE